MLYKASGARCHARLGHIPTEPVMFGYAIRTGYPGEVGNTKILFIRVLVLITLSLIEYYFLCIPFKTMDILEKGYSTVGLLNAF